MALGEAACVSVHGANRLGSNSLLDLVVFGRAAGLRAAELVKPGENCRNCRPTAPSCALAARSLPQRQWRARRRRMLRCKMQRVMQSDCAVYRTGEVLAEGVAQGQRRLERNRGCRRSRTAR